MVSHGKSHLHNWQVSISSVLRDVRKVNQWEPTFHRRQTELQCPFDVRSGNSSGSPTCLATPPYARMPGFHPTLSYLKYFSPLFIKLLSVYLRHFKFFISCASFYGLYCCWWLISVHATSEGEWWWIHEWR